MAKYKKCPRCELNYIPNEEEMCDVCKKELGLDTSIVLLDDIIDDDEQLKLCPVCKTAYIGMDEDMCENCLARASAETNVDEDNDDWRTYLDDDDTQPSPDEDIISLDELADDEEYDDDEFEDEENSELELGDYPDDFDSYDDFDDYDDDDEESEDED